MKAENLIGKDLHGQDLRNANLRGVDGAYVDLSKANLRKADLRGADLHDAVRMAADMSAQLKMLDTDVVERLRRLLERAGLPVEAPPIGAQRALDYMRVDKKVQAGRIRLILLQQLGRAIVTGDYPDDALQATLTAHFG